MALIFFDPFGLFNMMFTLFLRAYCYRGLKNVAPEKTGKILYSQTPVVNSRFFEIIVSSSSRTPGKAAKRHTFLMRV